MSRRPACFLCRCLQAGSCSTEWRNETDSDIRPGTPTRGLHETCWMHLRRKKLYRYNQALASVL